MQITIISLGSTGTFGHMSLVSSMIKALEGDAEISLIHDSIKLQMPEDSNIYTVCLPVLDVLSILPFILLRML